MSINDKDLKELKRDAKRYRWLREQVMDVNTKLKAQAMVWNSAPDRKRFDKAIDEAMKER